MRGYEPRDTGSNPVGDTKKKGVYMKLETAVEIAKACDLTTYQEALDNINYHAMNAFAYTEIATELKELADDFKASGHKLTDKL